MAVREPRWFIRLETSGHIDHTGGSHLVRDCRCDRLCHPFFAHNRWHHLFPHCPLLPHSLLLYLQRTPKRARTAQVNTHRTEPDGDSILNVEGRPFRSPFDRAPGGTDVLSPGEHPRFSLPSYPLSLPTPKILLPMNGFLLQWLPVLASDITALSGTPAYPVYHTNEPTALLPERERTSQPLALRSNNDDSDGTPRGQRTASTSLGTEIPTSILTSGCPAFSNP